MQPDSEEDDDEDDDDSDEQDSVVNHSEVSDWLLCLSPLCCSNFISLRQSALHISEKVEITENQRMVLFYDKI